ncbi:MAG: hypothetical protein LBU88_07025 [Treponema sp.]|jgi:hypothetical protein|nr:hypothetical protein [Treponema sp.]
MKPKPKRKKMAILIGAAIAILTPYIIFLCRQPVLIVSDMAFIPLYGKERLRSESRAAALALYRPVKMVMTADDAGDDVVPHAISNVSRRPYCVIFPLRFTYSARMYREQNPDIPIIILEGRYGENSPANNILGPTAPDFFIYKTDINTDFYIAGLAAAILVINREKTEETEEIEEKGRIVVFIESDVQRQGREAFLRGINTLENPPNTSFYTSFGQFSHGPGIICAILAGTGGAFMENSHDIPVIFYTWADPQLIPEEAVLILDDSPLAQTVTAVRMASEGLAEGQIQSKIIYKNPQKINRRLLHKMQK